MSTPHGLDLDRNLVPDQNRTLSLCRILLAVTEILDVPRVFLEEAAARSRSLQLRYELLGQRDEILLENPLVAETIRAESSRGCGFPRRAGRNGEGRGRGGRGARDQTSGSLMPVSVNYFR